MKIIPKSRITTMTRKGQVTIPVEMRRALSLEEGDSVRFVLDEGSLRILPIGNVVARTAGALKSDMLYATAEEERRATEEAIAEDVMRRMNNS